MSGQIYVITLKKNDKNQIQFSLDNDNDDTDDNDSLLKRPFICKYGIDIKTKVSK